MAGAVYEHVLRVDDTQTPRFGAIAGLARAGSGKIRIIE
jgi:hypothetical protein